MYFLTSFCLAVLLTFTSGSPLGLRSLNVNLISCPTDSLILDQVLQSSRCAVFCLIDGDCASGLVCCSTGCGARCVAETILETSDSNDQRSLDKESMIEKQLAVLEEKLDEKRKEQESNPFTLYGEDDGEEDVVANETVPGDGEDVDDDDSGEADESSDEGDEQSEDEVEDEQEEEEAEQEEEVSPTPSPSFQESSSSTVYMDSSEDDDEDDDDGDDEDDDVLAGEDDDDDDTEFDDYSYFEEVTEDDLEFLLMKLLLALKNKQKSTHSPWSDVVHNSRSLLEDSKNDPFKNDFFINALPPADALKSHEVEEGKRELEGSMQGFFHDEPFKREDISNQGATGRRSSMERRKKLAREVDREDSPNLTKELINASNMMR